MTMLAAPSMHSHAMARDDGEDPLRAALARLPVGRPASAKEAKRLAEAEAAVAAGERGHSTVQVMAAVRARFGR